MKVRPFVAVKLWQNSRFYLFGSAIGLAALHLILNWKIYGDLDQIIISVLFWGATLCLVWRKQDNLNLESDLISSFFGILLIGLVFYKSISLFWFDISWLKILPLLSVLGLGLVASGCKGLKQYWREMIIVLLLCLPTGLFTQIVDRLFHISTITTQFAVFLLWYVGFEVSRQATIIVLPNDYAQVAPACTGITTAFLLLKLSVIYILIFSTNWRQRILLVIGAISIAFLTSSIRVALIVTVISNRPAFDYWHSSPGNQIFSTVAIFLFGFLCRYFHSSNELSNQESRKLNES